MGIKQPGEGFRGVNGCVGYLLRQASHALHLKINRELSSFDMTYPQFTVLNMINLEPGSHGADIGRLCLLSPQAVNSILLTLEKAKLIERKPHETHGRILQLFITRKGKDKLDKVTKVINTNVIDSILSLLNKKQEKFIREWLVECTKS